MAGNQDSGRVLAFKLNEKELQAKIDEYMGKADSGEIFLPCWPHFCSFLGLTEDDLDEVMERGFEVKGAYYDRAVMLKNMAQWCMGQLTSNPNWSGKNAAKAIFLLKQGLGRMRKYTDNDKNTNNGPVEVKISFGGADPRSKRARK